MCKNRIAYAGRARQRLRRPPLRSGPSGDTPGLLRLRRRLGPSGSLPARQDWPEASGDLSADQLHDGCLHQDGFHRKLGHGELKLYAADVDEVICSAAQLHGLPLQ